MIIVVCASISVRACARARVRPCVSAYVRASHHRLSITHHHQRETTAVPGIVNLDSLCGFRQALNDHNLQLCHEQRKENIRRISSGASDDSDIAGGQMCLRQRPSVCLSSSLGAPCLCNLAIR